MKLRVIAVCTLLLLAALPTFALPVCEECNYETNTCEAIPGSFERCTYDFSTGVCYTYPGRCSTPYATTVLAEWNVASVEISRPSQDSITITAPAVVTKVQTATELK